MYSSIKISEFLHRKKEIVKIDPDAEYALVTVKLHHKGVVLREKKKGRLLGSSMYKISKGQFILSGIDARNGAFGIVPDELDGAIITNDFWCFDIDEKKVKRDFFYWLSNTPLFLDACVKSSKGETQRIRLQKDLFFNFEFHFPPINMQEDFLRGIQKFNFSLSVLRSEQTYQSTHLFLLRQTILQEAIEGKLTAKWREQNPALISGNNHASKLLEKIKAEKERLIKEGRIKKDKPLVPISDAEKPFELPYGWVWSKLGDVILHLPRNGYSPKEVAHETSIKSLKLGATTYGKFNPREFKYIADEIPEDSVFWLEPEDILIQRSNSLDYVGVSAIYTGKSKEFIYPDLMMKIKIMRPLSVNLIYNFLSSPLIREYFRSRAKGSQQTMPKINQGVVINVSLPIPPIYEQSAIVERVGKLMGMIDELEKQVSERKEQSEMLMQSVLREAFAG